MTFRSTSRQLVGRLGLAAAIAALATSAAVQATPASAAPPSGLGDQGVGDGPVGPSGCRGDCGIFQSPSPYRPKPKPKPCRVTDTGNRSCEPRPGCSGGVCTPPPPPTELPTEE